MWGGLFIYDNGYNLTIGNMYRFPHEDNNNRNIETFVKEIYPAIDIIQKEYTAIVGDFNKDLLQMNERENMRNF